MNDTKPSKNEVIQEVKDCLGITEEQAIEAFHTVHFHCMTSDAIRELQRKANLWDAFTSLGRIRTLGSAKLGEEGYQHMGFELWTIYGIPGEFEKLNTESVERIETFLDAWILTQTKAKS